MADQEEVRTNPNKIVYLMTRIAKKKGVDNKAGYVVKPIAVKDIEKQADFGTFKITRTRDCIAYTNYVGYSVITKPYTTTPEGQATKLSLYEWLNYALEMQEYLTEHKDEKNPDLDMTNGEWLEQIKVITEANLTKPCVVFTDADYATEEALNHIKWLNEKTKQLQAAMTQTPPEEDEKKNEEEFGRAVGDENLRNNLQLDNIEGD